MYVRDAALCFYRGASQVPTAQSGAQSVALRLFNRIIQISCCIIRALPSDRFSLLRSYRFLFTLHKISSFLFYLLTEERKENYNVVLFIHKREKAQKLRVYTCYFALK